MQFFFTFSFFLYFFGLLLSLISNKLLLMQIVYSNILRIHRFNYRPIDHNLIVSTRKEANWLNAIVKRP